MGKSRKVPAGNGLPLNVSRKTRHVPQASALSLAATHMAGVAELEAGATVTARLKRWWTLSNCTRGSVRLSVLLRSRLRVTPPPHRTAPVVSVTWMKVLTNSTISVPLVAALGPGATPHPTHPTSLMPSKLLLTVSARWGAAAAGGTSRVPDVGRDGRVGRGRPWNSSILGLTGGGVLASGDLAASLKSTMDAVPVPTPPERCTSVTASGRATSTSAAIARQPTPPKTTERNNVRTSPCVLATAGVAGFSDGRRLGTIEPVLKPSVLFVLLMIFSSDSLSVVRAHTLTCVAHHSRSRC